MGDAGVEAGAVPASRPVYRQLDRSKAEFRLLKILPPATRTGSESDPMGFSTEAIRCELQYESLDAIAARSGAKQASINSILAYLLQDIPSSRAEDNETDTPALMDLLGRRLGSTLSVSKSSVHDMGEERMKALETLYATSIQVIEAWRPEGIPIVQKSFEQWLGSWIWTPLSGDAKHVESESLGYFALSYVWRDQPPATLGPESRELDDMITASGMSMRQALEKTGMTTEEINQVCGDPADTADGYAEIILDNERVLVTNYLEKALRTLREIPEIQRGARVWVDALCINQQDVEEKNFEVKRMGDIYRKADRVLSYLGEEDGLSDYILELMDGIGEVVKRAESLAPVTLNFFRALRSDIAVALTRLLMRPYFSRIWIVQEIVLGGDRSIAICGKRRFSWTSILRCGNMLKAGMSLTTWNWDTKLSPTGDDDNDDSTEELTLADMREGITKLQMLRDAHIDCTRIEKEESQGEYYVPSSNTLWFRIPSSNKATDTRDLIYGMMNLLPKRLADGIHVDYAASASGFVDAMRSFAEAHIASTQSLDWILNRYFSPFMGHQDWPTWVPNLAQPFSSAHWSWALNLEGSACPGIPCNPSFATDRVTRKPLLICQGVKIDTVVHASENMVKDGLARTRRLAQVLVDSMTAENAAEVYPMLQNIQRSARKKHAVIIPEDDEPESEDTTGADGTDVQGAAPDIATTTHKYGDAAGLEAALGACLARVGVKLAGGQSIFNFPLDISDEDVETLQRALQSREFSAPAVMTLNGLRDEGALGGLDLWDGVTFRDLFPPGAAGVDPASYSAPEIGDDRGVALIHLFTTAAGAVGACLGNVRPGDELFLLPGCSMPVLLKKSRAVQGAYMLRGGVYVPGIMAGEALSDNVFDQDGFKTVIIS
ncbi:heterokaryon incompatibility protein-domain-containing protein [Xylariales sp. PMI_506]|nr:heterokaryon incompatibility protein-domain-containing protein [Xylariales sp. PMI_506]